jgi:uncharacterized protein YlxW (UPF0749 family)
MNPFEMVVLIVAIVMIASVIKARHGHFPRRGRTVDTEPQERIENQRLREEVSELKERIKVLERITVDKENTLARQIEELRDR